MENKNQPIKYSSVKFFGPKNIIVLLLIVFFLLIAYKYISSSIQENKEKAIIQERIKVQQVENNNVTQLEKTRSQIKAVLPVTNGPFDDCSFQNEVYSAKDWIHACYLRDLLSSQCKQIFDINGYYLTGDYDSSVSPDGYVDAYTYLNNAQICNCHLPTEIASQLNNDSKYATAHCSSSQPKLHW